MNKTKISAEVVADSVDVRGNRLTSLLITFPRIILAEINTHRMLSKNTSSSRAIPFHKMVKAVQENPFIPIAWQKEHKGMQGSEYIIDERQIRLCNNNWLNARDNAVSNAHLLSIKRATKQLCNRLLEPFMWTTMLITGSKEGWDNFFNLRCPSYEWEYEEGVIKAKSKEEFLEMFIKRYPTNGERELHDWEAVDENFDPVDSNFWRSINKGQAEIHMMALAESIYDAMNESTPRKLAPGQWHIPFYEQITDLLINELVDGEAAFILDEKIAKISVAMAAHTSYTVVGGEVVKSSKKWLELYDRLLSYDPPHSSPLEHCARAMSDEEYECFLKGEREINKNTNHWSDVEYFYDYDKIFGWCNNLKGFIPYRYFIDNKIEL